VLETIRPNLTRRGIAGVVALVLLALAVLGATASEASAPCATSGPDRYTVTVCITAPADGSTITSGKTVTATVRISGSSVGVAKVRFDLDGGYVLTDFQAPFTFTLPSRRWVDGTRTLTALATLRDGYLSSPASVDLTFANDVTSPPVNTDTLRPRTGRAAVEGEPFVVAAVGDGVDGRGGILEVADMIAAWNANLLLYLGDVYERGSPAEFVNYWGGQSGPMGRFTAITNPTPGNHEYQLDPEASGYFDFWDNVPHSYAVTAGGWRIISIDTNRQYRGRGPTSRQYGWLRDELRANADRCTLVFAHHPRFTAGEHMAEGDAIASLWSLMVAEGADLYLSGHEHNYQRWEPLDGSGAPSATGLTQIIAGTGGMSRYPVTDDPRLVRSFDGVESALGAVRIVLAPTEARLEYRATDPVDPRGRLLDAATIPCRAPSQTVFSDGFESGLSKWTVRGAFTAQATKVQSGAAAGRAMSTGTDVASAVATLTRSGTDATFNLSYRVDAQGTNQLNLLRLQSSSGANVATIFVSTAGYLMARNDVARTNLSTSIQPARGTWHDLQVKIHVAGAQSRLEVTNDGIPVPGLSRTMPLGTEAIARVMVGDNVEGRSYTSYVDDVHVTIP